MLVQPTADEWGAISQIRRSRNGEVVVNMLRREYAEVTARLVNEVNPHTTTLLQGRAQALQDILNLVDTADEVLKKLGAQTPI